MATEAGTRTDNQSKTRKGGYRLPAWSPIERVSHTQLAIASLVLVALFLVVSIVPFIMGWISEDTFRRMGIPGIFIANVVSTGSLIPIPGSAAVGQALVVAGASELWIPGVFVAALLGMTIGESTAYLAGRSGRHIAQEYEFPFEGSSFGDWLHKVGDWITDAMSHPKRAFAIIAVVSGVPNPFFDVVGITAGATRMNFWHFLLAVAIGDVFRIALLIWLGNEFLDFSELFGG